MCSAALGNLSQVVFQSEFDTFEPLKGLSRSLSQVAVYGHRTDLLVLTSLVSRERIAPVPVCETVIIQTITRSRPLLDENDVHGGSLLVIMLIRCSRRVYGLVQCCYAVQSADEPITRHGAPRAPSGHSRTC